MEARRFLPVGTQIDTEQGHRYRITGAPVGCGGGSVIYPVRQLIQNDGSCQMEEIPFVMKECFPVSQNHIFLRNEHGEIIPENSREEDLQYLRRSQRLLLEEGSISKRIYRTAARMIPIREMSQRITLTLPGQAPSDISNTITIMDSLSEKGQSIGAWIKAQGRFSPLAAFRIIQQLLFSLQEVHQAGYLHLDIQDGNVFLHGTLNDRSELVTLIDFGAARSAAEGKTAPIADKVIFTTQGFSAPEMLTQNDGTLQLGPEADLYSVGCLLLYLLTGQKPSSAELLKNQTGIYLPPNQLRRIKCPKHLVDRLQRILAQALARDPKDRYHTADAMLADITALTDALMPSQSTLANVDYDAFICYKHGAVDSQAAKLLQEKLEGFRAPRDLASPKHPFRRVFLDEGELSSCADFGDQIRSALKNASWLIVICSPDTPLSPWVKSEIDTFLEYHDRTRILALLTGGDPKTSFPPQLLGGNGVGEVLAADARGETAAEVRKKLSGDALLRIAAPMLETTFDSLKQRRKIQLMQRIAAISAAGLTLALAFSLYALRQNQRIQEEYRNNLLNESKYLAALAEDSLYNGDPLKALEIALRALPSETQDRPVVPHAQYVAEQAQGLYMVNDGSLIRGAMAEGAFSHTGTVNSGYYFDKTHHILLTTDINALYIWDSDTCQTLGKIPYPMSRTDAFHGDLVNEDQGRLFYAGYEGAFCYDYLNQTRLWQYRIPVGFSLAGMLYLPQSELLAVLEYEMLSEVLQVTLVRAADGTPLQVYPISLPSALMGGYVATPALTASAREDLLVFRLRFEDQQQDTAGQSGSLTVLSQDSLAILDTKTGQVRYIHPHAGWINSIAFTPQGNLLFCAADRGMSGVAGIEVYAEAVTSVICADVSTGENLWTFQDSGCAYYAESPIRFDPALDHIAVVGYGSQCAVLDLITGQCLQKHCLTGAVVDLAVPQNQTFRAYTADGYTCLCRYDSGEWSGSVFWTEEAAEILECDGILFIKSSADPSLIRKYNRYPQDENWQQLVPDVSHPQRSLNKHYVQAPYIALYGQYAEPLTVYNADTGILQEVVLTGGDTSCSLRTESVLGIYPLDGVPNLIFDCRDFCTDPAHSANCLLCVDLQTLQQKTLYLPPPWEDFSYESWSQRLAATNWTAHAEDTVYFACTESYNAEDGTLMDGLYVFSWDMGASASRFLAEYSILKKGYTASFHPVALLPSPDGSKLLLLDQHHADDDSYLYYNVYLADTQAGTLQCILSDLRFQDFSGLFGLYGYQVAWDQTGSRFAIPGEESLVVYDLTGAALCSIPFPEAAKNIISFCFVPESGGLLVLSRDSRLSMYDTSSGALLESCFLHSGSLGETRWQYLDDNKLILDYYWGMALIDLSAEAWGLSSELDSAIGYDARYDRFYTLSESGGGNTPLGCFQRYSIEEVVSMGNAVLGMKP